MQNEPARGQRHDHCREHQLLDAHNDNSPLGVVELDPKYRIVLWAASAERMFGYMAAEALGKTPVELGLVYPGDARVAAADWAALVDGTKVRGVTTGRARRRDGSILWCEWYTSAIREEGGGLASVLALALDVTERKRAEEAERREFERTRVLLDTADALATGRSLDEVLNAVCDALLSTTEHSRVWLNLWDEQRRVVISAASKGAGAIPVGTVIAFDDLTEAGRRFIGAPNTMVIDYDQVAPGPAALVGYVPLHLALAVPMVYADRLIGFFTVDDAQRRTPFDEREIEIAQAIASQASIAIEHARLADIEQKRMTLSEALSAVDLAIHSSLEWDDIAARALSETAAALGADVAVIGGREDSEQVIWADHGFDQPIRGMRFRDPGLIVALDAVGQGPLVFDDASSDERVASVAAAFGVASAVAAPLLIHRQRAASLVVAFRRPHHFDDTEVGFVQRVASGLSLALENARLYAGERDLADRLQRAMLTVPDCVEGIEFAHAYHSAAEAALVGGDFYDLFDIGDGRIGVTIGDVAGKGLEAAVLTSLAKNAIRTHACELGKTPAEVLTLTNDVILKATPTESFVTVVFGVLDPKDGRFEYANAGHTSGVVARPDGDTLALPPTGPLLGAIPEVSFDPAEVTLGPDDVLFLYTDGLTEARRGKAMYGEERVFDIVADGAQTPLELVERVTEDALGYTGDGLSDDLALLAVKRSRAEDGAPPASSVLM